MSAAEGGQCPLDTLWKNISEMQKVDNISAKEAKVRKWREMREEMGFCF